MGEDHLLEDLGRWARERRAMLRCTRLCAAETMRGRFPVGTRVRWRTASARIEGVVVGYTAVMVRVRWDGDEQDSRAYANSLASIERPEVHERAAESLIRYPGPWVRVEPS